MTKTYKTTLTALAMALVVLAPACRTKKTPVAQPPVTDTAPPVVPDVQPPPPPRPAETNVPEQPDFVQERPTEEVLPSDIEQLNEFVQERGYVRDAFFHYDEATLDADAQAALTATASWLRNNRGYNLLIEGHCDERGTEQYNLALGDRRANAVREFLMTLGIDASRLRTVSYGEERPFDEGHDESAWGKNRRAHLVLVR